MRILDGEQLLVRIFLGESDRYQHAPLSRALLERLCREGFAGATVTHGLAGFGAEDLVFATGSGKPIAPNNVLRGAIFRACAALGLARVTWLTLRADVFVLGA